MPTFSQGHPTIEVESQEIRDVLATGTQFLAPAIKR